MTVEVEFHTDPAGVLRAADAFLASDPVLHNLILTLLQVRVRQPESGRYWVARVDGAPAGVVFQSPPHFGATVTPMTREAVGAVVDAISEAGIPLPGVHGEATTVALFAGQWSERRHCGVVPVEGQRVYEVRDVRRPPQPGGGCRRAVAADRQLLEEWLRNFSAEVGQQTNNVVGFVDRTLSSGLLWLWEDDEPRSMAAYSDPIQGVTRIQAVYTPPDSRRRGYAAACVADLSQRLLHKGLRSILYTDLGNPTSNSVYRRIGYRAVAEALRYRFD